MRLRPGRFRSVVGGFNRPAVETPSETLTIDRAYANRRKRRRRRQSDRRRKPDSCSTSRARLEFVTAGCWYSPYTSPKRASESMKSPARSDRTCRARSVVWCRSQAPAARGRFIGTVGRHLTRVWRKWLRALGHRTSPSSAFPRRPAGERPWSCPRRWKPSRLFRRVDWNGVDQQHLPVLLDTVSAIISRAECAGRAPRATPVRARLAASLHLVAWYPAAVSAARSPRASGFEMREQHARAVVQGHGVVDELMRYSRRVPPRS